jgi:hypothetical protein
MRCSNKSQNASCLAGSLKNIKRLADLGYNVDMTCLYLQIRLGVDALRAGWFGQMRQAIPVSVPNRPITPAGSQTTSRGTGVLTHRSVERVGRRHWLASFALSVR